MSEPTLEIELKARVADVAAARQLVEAAGAVLVFDGDLADRIYDSAARTFLARDLVLRLRTYTDKTGVSAHLDWKGPTQHENGFKLRTELTTGVSDANALASILDGVGFGVVRSIDRRIAQYELAAPAAGGTVVIRFERYPRMDELVEVEGSRESIEYAIAVLQIPREQFVGDRLTDFVTAYETRTGNRAALCAADLEAA